MRERYPGYARGRQSARTQLTANLRRLFALNALADARRLPVDAVLEELEQRTVLNRPVSRRRFLGGAALAGAGVAFGPAATRVLASSAFHIDGPDATHRRRRRRAGRPALQPYAVDTPSHPLDALRRSRGAYRRAAAGRLRDYFSNGLITEHGGAFIDSEPVRGSRPCGGARIAARGLQRWRAAGVARGVLVRRRLLHVRGGEQRTGEAFGYKAFHDAVTESNTAGGPRAS